MRAYIFMIEMLFTGAISDYSGLRGEEGRRQPDVIR